MCGIAGFWNPNGLREDPGQSLKRMITTLRHRGPDGFGFHVDLEAGLGMAHARLSIIDLETGEQPLFSPDGSSVVTVNGEFYDYKRIRTNLRLQGATFRTRSDSEIALPLYERHGLDFVNHLRGEFAFVLYDGKQKQLVMVRDRFGIRPMFYHLAENTIYWASEIKGLLAHGVIPRKFSQTGLLHQLMHTMVPGTTAYEGIHALKPGCMLVVREHKARLEMREHRYWDVDFPRSADRDDCAPETYVESVREVLMEAVQQRLEADVPVGCYLSGGIDSCSMLGMAASLQKSPVKAFTISFDNKDYDEAAIAKTMADQTGADQEQIDLRAEDLYGSNYVKTLYHAERTFYNTLGVAKWCMSRRVNECGYRVVVTGEGSDELFGGYPAFKRDMLLYDEGDGKLQTEKYRKAMDESNRLFRGAILAEETVSHPAFDDVCGFTPSWIQPWIQMLGIARPLLHDDILSELQGYDPVEAIASTFDRTQLEGRHALDKAQYTWCKTMLECQILNWGGDRVDMAHSMESRPAFLDHRVAELARTIPPKFRIRGNTEKWVLREAMKNILPEVLYKREKFAFMAPPGHTEKRKQAALDDLVRAFMSDAAIVEAGIFDLHRLKTFMEEYKVDKDPVSLTRKDALLNHILGLHILHDQFIKEPHPAGIERAEA